MLPGNMQDYAMRIPVSLETLQKIGSATLLGATAVVGAAIEIEGSTGRILNGAGGITWFAAAGMLGVAAVKSGEPKQRWLVAIGLTAVVAFVAKPTDLTLAASGLGASGVIIASLVRKHPLLWATLIPALYLPMHIGTAILKAIGRSALGMESSIRSEPPPTAAIVPFVMVAAAMIGGWIVSRVRDNRSGGKLGMLTGR